MRAKRRNFLVLGNVFVWDGACDRDVWVDFLLKEFFTSDYIFRSKIVHFQKPQQNCLMFDSLKIITFETGFCSSLEFS